MKLRLHVPPAVITRPVLPEARARASILAERVLGLALLCCLSSAARAVDCSTILGNRVSPCSFDSAAQVAAWSSLSGDAVFVAGEGQNGGAIEGTSEDIGVAGFSWMQRSPCFPISSGQNFAFGYSVQHVDGAVPECFVGEQFWTDAACTVGNGGGNLPPPFEPATTWATIYEGSDANAGSVAMSVLLTCRADATFRVRADNVFAYTTPGPACQPYEEGACLHAGRFEVRVDWQTDGDSGAAQVMQFGDRRSENDESVFWWFFGPQNFEMGVKLLQACIPSLGNKYWVFISGLTNQGWTVHVRDTRTNATRTYTNPVGRLSRTFADTAAFDCP